MQNVLLISQLRDALVLAIFHSMYFSNFIFKATTFEKTVLQVKPEARGGGKFDLAPRAIKHAPPSGLPHTRKLAKVTRDTPEAN